MNQKKIGHFLKALRQEKGDTQERLSELLGVSNRTVSRWENGVNMPDFDLLIEIAKHFGVGIEELLDGERRKENMEEKTQDTLLKVANYDNEEKKIFSTRLCMLFTAALIAMVGYILLESRGLTEIRLYDDIASALLGFVTGMIVVGILYTSGRLAKIKAFKTRMLKKAAR